MGSEASRGVASAARQLDSVLRDADGGYVWLPNELRARLEQLRGQVDQLAGDINREYYAAPADDNGPEGAAAKAPHVCERCKRPCDERLAVCDDCYDPEQALADAVAMLERRVRT